MNPISKRTQVTLAVAAVMVAGIVAIVFRAVDNEDPEARTPTSLDSQPGLIDEALTTPSPAPTEEPSPAPRRSGGGTRRAPVPKSQPEPEPEPSDLSQLSDLPAVPDQPPAPETPESP